MAEHDHDPGLNEEIPVFTAEEANAAIESFLKKSKIALTPKEIHGAQMALKGKDEPLIEVMSENPNQVTTTIPDEFPCVIRGEHRVVPVKLVKKKIAQPCVRPGHSARWQDAALPGTTGWNVYLLNDVVCLSARHAICDLSRANNIDDWVWLNDARIAKVLCHQPISFYVPGAPAPTNTWDLACAKYLDSWEIAAEATMRTCQSGHATSVYPYPQNVTPAHLVGPGDAKFHKVGNAAPTCDVGRLMIAAGVNRFIDFGPNRLALFVDQLAFEEIAKPGDSGSIVVRNSGNTVTGMVIGGSPGETVANPLYRFGWTWIGDNAAPSGVGRLPVFDRTPPSQPNRCFG
jgi:hypothetical protein